MTTHLLLAVVFLIWLASSAFAQVVPIPPATLERPPSAPPAPAQLPLPAVNPFVEPIEATAGAIKVNLVDFATLPAINGEAARMTTVVDEPGTRRLFANDLRGIVYAVSYDGKSVGSYLNAAAAEWKLTVMAVGLDRGLTSVAFHPQFAQPGTPGFGKFYTLISTNNMQPPADFVSGADTASNDNVLYEWSAKTPAAATYDGGEPRELLRIRHPFGNNNAAFITFNPLARPNTPEFGLLYVSSGDGGGPAGDPLKLSQNLNSGFGKILRIDPLGRNSANGKYGIPASNPFVADSDPRTLGEIYAYGFRNAQRFGWDPRDGKMLSIDIGHSFVEELDVVTPGANAGWAEWEGSFRWVSRNELKLDDRRSDPKITYPIAEYDHSDPLIPGRASATGVIVYRDAAIPQLRNKVLFGDNPNGEVFYVNADPLPASGGQAPIRRVLFNSGGTAKSFLQILREKTPEASRADLRFATGPNNRIFLLNKRDGIIREMVR